MHFSEKDFDKNSVKKDNIKNKYIMNTPHEKNLQHPFWYHGTFCLQTVRGSPPPINPNLYCVPRIIMFKIQKDQSTTTKYISQKP